MKVDVAVVGAGPAGAVAAGLLARAGLRVVVVDRPFEGFRIGESLSPGARPLLGELGLLHVVADQPLAHGTLSAWGSDDLHVSDHFTRPFGSGWTLDRTRFDARLREWASACGVERVDALVRGVSAVEGAIELRLDRGASIFCEQAIDASGRRSVLAARLGARPEAFDELTAIHARFRAGADDDPDHRVLVESAAYGWWYSVRTPTGDRVVALFTDREALGRSPSREFFSLLARTRFVATTLASRCHAAIGPPRGADARTRRLSTPVGPRWLAVGDAAFAMDPLSSHGLMNALVTARDAARAILDTRGGDPQALARYRAQLERAFALYLTHRAAAYAEEARWPHEPFWRSRRPRRT